VLALDSEFVLIVIPGSMKQATSIPSKEKGARFLQLFVNTTLFLIPSHENRPAQDETVKSLSLLNKKKGGI
jgi:hypothetical protein